MVCILPRSFVSCQQPLTNKHQCKIGSLLFHLLISELYQLGVNNRKCQKRSIVAESVNTLAHKTCRFAAVRSILEFSMFLSLFQRISRFSERVISRPLHPLLPPPSLPSDIPSAGRKTRPDEGLEERSDGQHRAGAPSRETHLPSPEERT